MNHALSLNLELVEQAAWGFRFRLTARNDSTVRLYLPFPQVTGLNFGDQSTHQLAEWYTTSLVEALGCGLPLPPAGSWSVEWRVRPCSIEPPPEAPGEFSDWDYRRWCVALKQGEYLLWYQWQVEEDYFDPDTHARLPDLEEAAKQQDAVVWRGQVLSNRLHVYHVDPRVASRDSER